MRSLISLSLALTALNAVQASPLFPRTGINGYEPYGCNSKGKITYHRALTKGGFNDPSSMTVEACTSFRMEKGYTIAGLGFRSAGAGARSSSETARSISQSATCSAKGTNQQICGDLSVWFKRLPTPRKVLKTEIAISFCNPVILRATVGCSPASDATRITLTSVHSKRESSTKVNHKPSPTTTVPLKTTKTTTTTTTTKKTTATTTSPSCTAKTTTSKRNRTATTTKAPSPTPSPCSPLYNQWNRLDWSDLLLERVNL
ncbi:hypothetical protein BJ742DRAFT_872660 [Cladochytrium replicatum]|nr:hypothetical protein BJ742DRAFT_872660 [Cladochytrium replicatum]